MIPGWCTRRGLCWFFCAIRGIIGTFQRRVWRALMRLSKNGLRHQQVRVYFINTLILVLLLKNSKFYTDHLLVVDSAVRLACKRQFSSIMQKRAAERAIVNLVLRPLFSQVIGKISVHCTVHPSNFVCTSR